jgi:hypothetical protein
MIYFVMFILLQTDLRTTHGIAGMDPAAGNDSLTTIANPRFTFARQDCAMVRWHLMKIVPVALAVGLAGCATQPSKINDVCAVLEQQDGWISNWQRSARKAERKHGVPMAILLATIRKESGFKSNARPPRPWKRQSSAYGYAQALDGTWDQYKRERGGFTSSRDDFDDAVDFVGWYHGKTVKTYGVAPNDAYSLYLAYYSGWSAFGKGTWRSHSGLQKTARETAQMAQTYERQLVGCR